MVKIKKVLFVATVTEMHINLFHIPYLKYFKEKGYETHVASKNDYIEKSKLNIPYCDVYHNVDFERNPFHKNNIVAFNKLKKIMINNEYDIIHCHTPVGGVITRLANLFVKNKFLSEKKAKVFYTAHGFHFFKGAPLKNWLLYYPIEKFLSKYTDVLITINKEDYFRAKKKFHSKDIRYVRGVGIEANKSMLIKTKKEIKNMQADLKITEIDFVVLSVGELNSNKNHEVVIRALHQLIKEDTQYKNIKYIIVGKGTLHSYLEQLIIKLNLSENVKLLGYRKDIAELCTISHVFAFPSQREGLGLAALEAMQNGLPIITSNVHGIVDYSINGITGYNCDPRDVSGFASNIKKIYHNKNLLKKMAIRNKEISNEFLLENVESDMKKIYEMVN